ncbi:MAG TPA: alkaline phosphatase family protein [Streptosporangiaceae bacterium]|nr:alkaline phosphatase family protein [Streptosporangiaceae bacterium]
MWNRLEQRELKRLEHRWGDQTPGPLPRPDLPAGTDLLPQIKHIVVLMMENHSYDNYLGMLQGRGEGMPIGPDGLPDVSNPGRDGTKIRAHHLSSTRQNPDVPSQSWHASHLQFDDGNNDGFVASTQDLLPGGDTSLGMGYWTEEDLPFYYGLARTFPLADHWFSSCLGPTFPNRRFLIAGTANGLIDDLPFDLIDYPPAGTVFDMLTRHGISWGNYHHVTKERSVLRRALLGRRIALTRRLMRLARWLPRVVTNVRGNKSFTADLFPLGVARGVLHLRSTREFFQHADDGTLPSFSIVDPDFDGYSEENPQDIRKGESFAAEVISRVMHGKGWPNTLLIWCYDEHGGYFDHVPPPEAVPPDDVEGRSVVTSPSWLHMCLRPFMPKFVAEMEKENAGPKRYDRYGFRIPAVLVSPFARRDYVCSKVLDHTSVLKLVEQKWNLPALTERDAAADSPLDALDLDSPPAFLDPPDLPKPALTWGSW